MNRAAHERGSAVPEFVLVLVVLVPVIAAIVHLALVMHVRNTVTSAASDGARSGAARGATTEHAVARTQSLISSAIAARFASEVEARHVMREGVPMVQVQVRTSVPALGLAGPSTRVSATAHAILQDQR
ncbi:MAG: pilus assembly protein [Actinomycetales bacterium]|nr:pilus assembly protein [Actinomycetales bacterium]